MIISSVTVATTFTVPNTKFGVPVVALANQDNAKLLQQLKSGFKKTISWHKHYSKWKTNLLIIRLIYIFKKYIDVCLSFKKDVHRARHTAYFLPQGKLEDYNIMIDGRKFSDQPIKTYVRTFEKIATSLVDDYTTVYLLDYLYFKEDISNWLR